MRQGKMRARWQTFACARLDHELRRNWERYGLTPDVVPTEFQAEGVIAALARVGIRGSRRIDPAR